jgi:hypothetical protein
MALGLLRTMAGAILVGVLATGCRDAQTNLDIAPNPVPLPAGAIPAPTDTSLRRAGMCNLAGAVARLEGVLEADPANPDWPVWLRATDGHRMYVKWPAGFSVRFDAKVELLDDQGVVVLTAGQAFRLPQVSFGEHLGTVEDPYLARGLWEAAGHCYAKRPG